MGCQARAGFCWLLFLSVPAARPLGASTKPLSQVLCPSVTLVHKKCGDFASWPPPPSPALISTWMRWLQVGGHSGLQFAHCALVAPGVGKMDGGIPKRSLPRQDEAAWGRKGAALPLCFIPAHWARADPWSALASRQNLLTFDQLTLPTCAGKTAPGISQAEELRWDSPCPPFPSAVGSKAEILGQTHPGRVLWAGLVRSCCWEARRAPKKL